MNTFYILEIVTIESGEGATRRESWEGERIEKPSQNWVGTFSDFDSAFSEGEIKRSMPEVVAVFIIEWRGENDKLDTGNYGQRHCSRGAEIMAIPYFFERDFDIKKCTTPINGIPRRVTIVKTGLWKKKICNIKNYLVGGGNWLTWSQKNENEK